MIAQRFHDYGKNSFDSGFDNDNHNEFRNSPTNFWMNNDIVHFFTNKPENNEAAGFDQDFPIHLRGLKESELEFLTTLRDKSSQRCKKEKTSPSTFLKSF